MAIKTKRLARRAGSTARINGGDRYSRRFSEYGGAQFNG